MKSRISGAVSDNGRRRTRENPQKFERILVVKLADIGDVLTATPALRALRETFPLADISALATPSSAAVLEDSPLIDEIIQFRKHEFDQPGGVANTSSLKRGLALWSELRHGEYDCVVTLHHLVTRWGTAKYAALALASRAACRTGIDNGRGWFLTHRVRDRGFGFMHEVEYALAAVEAIGASTNDLGLEIFVGPEDNEVAEKLLGSTDSRPLVAIHPGSGSYSLLRRWPASSFSAVGDALARDEGASVVIVGGLEEVDLCQKLADGMRHRPLVLAGRTGVKELAAVLKRCDLFIGNDSGVTHIAAAVGTKVVAIFGPSNHLAWGPWGKSGPIGEQPAGGGAIVRGEASCSPCLYGADWGKRHRHHVCQTECLRAINPERVIDIARQVLEIGEIDGAQKTYAGKEPEV